ncbi:hypothetical protein HYC85_011050 [Camellia sinensis]|uniref:Uncharacterized protein n=1 Tax=Camellia sinensis TaxID=4442 RepID=A0A7J7HMC6_CAMSI|nr:hypothetical protein HYC85_011050 [Camellia sinensis]
MAMGGFQKLGRRERMKEKPDFDMIKRQHSIILTLTQILGFRIDHPNLHLIQI